MGKVITALTMSLDGFIAEPNDDIRRLFKWYYSGDVPFPLPGTNMVFKMSSASAEVFQEYFRTTGAFVTGRRDFDVSHAWGGQPPFGIPAFIVTHNPPQEWLKENSPFTFVTDGVPSAIAKAKAAAGDKHVLLSGASLTQQCVKLGLLDEIYIELASILLGGGISLFGQLGIDPVELERIAVIEGKDVTHLRFRVIK
jgi:dihydrofolate reductase